MQGKPRAPVTVRVEGIRKTFPAMSKTAGETIALANVTLDFQAGAFTTLLGPSGCGKTTLLRIIAGFTTTEAGVVSIGEHEVGAVPPWKRDIGFVFQNYALWPHMSVQDNVAYGLRLRKIARKEIVARVQDALNVIGLAGMGDRYPGQLSGGQQQRVALARALVLQPQVLLLDEPLSNLDAKLRVEMRKEIRRLQREVGITTIYVTHDQEEALEISDIVAVMSRGQVEQVGTPEEIYRHPASVFVAGFVGTVNLLTGQVTADGCLCLENGLALPLGLGAAQSGQKLTIAVRPENMSLVSKEAAPLHGRLVGASFLGNIRRVTVDMGNGLHLLVEHRKAVSEGDVVGVIFGEFTQL